MNYSKNNISNKPDKKPDDIDSQSQDIVLAKKIIAEPLAMQTFISGQYNFVILGLKISCPSFMSKTNLEITYEVFNQEMFQGSVQLNIPREVFVSTPFEVPCLPIGPITNDLNTVKVVLSVKPVFQDFKHDFELRKVSELKINSGRNDGHTNYGPDINRDVNIHPLDQNNVDELNITQPMEYQSKEYTHEEEIQLNKIIDILQQGIFKELCNNEPQTFRNRVLEVINNQTDLCRTLLEVLRPIFDAALDNSLNEQQKQIVNNSNELFYEAACSGLCYTFYEDLCDWANMNSL
jgi:hypothetical protein